ncbi:MAG: threonine ammonia-lyase, partial [Nocardioidaceae bacterium]
TGTRAVERPTRADLEDAWQVVHKHLRPTPLDETTPGGSVPVTLKLESLQPTGAFKVRGALAALAAVDPERPVVTASAGNHAMGIAFAADRLERKATVVTAQTASPVKLAGIRRLGLEPVCVGTSYDDAEAHALELAAAGARYVSPYNDPHVIAGQATMGYELDNQLSGEPLTVVCGVGGGGMASGLGLWASTRPDVRVVGVEVSASMAVSAAVAAGRQVDVEIGPTIADGMGGNIEPGSVTVDLVSQYVDDLVSVSEQQVRDAIRYLAFERGIVAEGSAAAPVAAALAGLVPSDRSVVAVVSGRNIAAGLLSEVLAENARG